MNILKLKVAFTTESAIQSRLKTAGYDYAVEEGKDIHATVYTNKVILVILYIG